MLYNSQLHNFSFNNITVKLWLPDMSALQAAYDAPQNANAPFPYWARLWPSALAMSRFIAANPELVKDKNVLELAGGLGLPGIVAAHFATRVLLSDYLPEAVAVMQASIAQNHLNNISCRQLDWHHLPPDLGANVLLLSDINYDPAAFEVLYKVLIRFMNRGTTTLLTTPQRLMAKPFIERLLPFCILQTEDEVILDNERHFITVMILQKQ